MADEYSFDVVSKVNIQNVDDAVNAVNREISVRFDFRGSSAEAQLDREKNEIQLNAENETRLRSLSDILKARIVKRGIDIKSLKFETLETALGGKVKQLVKINQGINQEKAKAIVADLKKTKLKVTPSIKSDQVRVTSKSKDALQEAISLLKKSDYGVPLQFENYR